MELTEKEVLRIKEALIISGHYTGDKSYLDILNKILVMEKEDEKEKKLRRVFG